MRKWLLIVGGIAVLVGGGVVALNGSNELATASVAQQAEPSLNDQRDGPALVGQMARFRLVDRAIDPSAVAWRTLDGERFSLTDYAGKVVLVNFWATWCGPCMQELPGINDLAKQLSSDRFAVVAINIDARPEVTATRWIERLGIDALPLFVDPQYQSANALGMRAMPSTFLIDADGGVIGMLEGGAEWDSPEAVDLLLHYIDAAQTEL